ncbi:hypothetical protein GCM10010106_08850 [Thermopolyspora flexuosa]|nr:hypothetical protein GCM10010106_08850 [Thermopolyspora flexuosa]
MQALLALLLEQALDLGRSGFGEDDPLLCGLAALNGHVLTPASTPTAPGGRFSVTSLLDATNTRGLLHIPVRHPGDLPALRRRRPGAWHARPGGPYRTDRPTRNKSQRAVCHH